MKIDLSILVVHYRVEDFLTALFGSMRNFLVGLPAEVLIWDNGSRRGRPPESESPFAMTWLRSPTNIGFGNGHNALAERAKGRRLLIINPDARFVPGGLERLWQTANENPQAGVVAPRLQHPNGRLQVSVFPPYSFSFDLRKSFWLEKVSLFSRRQAELEKKLKDAQAPFPAGWATGACFLVSREAWEKAGGFDPNFFFGGEDADFCLRVRKAGFEILCEPRAVVIHQAGQSLEQVPRGKVLYYYQKRLYYAHKHFSPLQFGFIWLVSTIELVAKWLVGSGLSPFRERWRQKRKGYAAALALIHTGRWRNSEALMQKHAGEAREPAEIAA